MSYSLLESHIAFQYLQEKAKEVGLTLRFSRGNFIFSDGLSGRYRNHQKETNILDYVLNASQYSEEALDAMIKMWKFCCDYHGMVKDIEGMEKVSD